MPDFIHIHPEDTVAVALKPVPEGTVFQGVSAAVDIPQGHKMALTAMSPGDPVIKYGFPIGYAAEAVAPGQWVHTHNLKTGLTDRLEAHYRPCCQALPVIEPRTFSGYRRADGRVGIRNEIWIIPAVGCVNDVAKSLAAENRDLVGQGLEGIYAFPHPYGCSQTGRDHLRTGKLLAALTRHPNAAGVLVVHLGCENLTPEQFRQLLGPYDENRVKFLNCQDAGDELAAGRQLLEQLARYAKTFTREPVPASELVVGLKCGGSDGLSGITANPVVGRFSDILVAMGGSALLTEVPEMFGAEGLLTSRCASRQVYEDTVAMIRSFRDYYTRHGEPVSENPSPGNRAGGITTLEEKSCGCLQKGGTAPISGVLGYGETCSRKGLNLLWGPGNDLVSTTALTAAGAHMILFTTGRGTPFGAPAPTLKIATNTPLAQRKAGWMDFNAGTLADGTATPASAAEALLELVLETASGKRTRAEERGFREIAIFKSGVTL